MMEAWCSNRAWCQCDGRISWHEDGGGTNVRAVCEHGCVFAMDELSPDQLIALRKRVRAGRD